jgi:hypothetical protein
MVNLQVKELLRQLRSATLDVANVAPLEQLSSSEFIADLRNHYPIVFQERVAGKKHEVGMARSLKFEVAFRKLPDSLFQQVSLLPVLKQCLFVSSYEGSISEITIANGIRVRPMEGAPGQILMKLGRGYKLDRTPDGWELKPLRSRPVALAETLLSTRGWRFEALLPFGTPR